MRFHRGAIEAAVGAAKVPERDAAAYLVDVLLERGRRIGRTYLDALTPLDHFRMHRDRLCATDLAVLHRLAKRGVVERLDDQGRVVARHAVNSRGRVCLPLGERSGRAMARLRVARDDGERPPMQVHFVGAPRPRIIGIVRRE